MSIEWKALLMGIVLAAGVGTGCGSSPEPPVDSSEVSETATDPAPTASVPTSLTEVFPDGLGRPLVLESCGSCHAAACSAIGQRTPARWNNLKEDHRDKVSDLSDSDYDVLFTYLSSNFNNSMPEPVVPPQFLEGGCTPF